MRRATVLAVPVRTLSRSISSHSVASYFLNVRCSQKCREICHNPHFWKFKNVQGCSRSLMLIKLKSLWPVLIMISSMSIPICNCSHTRRANSSKITFFQRGTPLWRPRLREPPHPRAQNFIKKFFKKLESLQ